VKCPSCMTAFHDNSQPALLGSDHAGEWGIQHRNCPECGEFIVHIMRGFREPSSDNFYLLEGLDHMLVKPQASSRPPPLEVPEPPRSDFIDAALVLHISPKASAALSRRCLQSVLRDPNAGNVRQQALANEIDEVIARGNMRSQLAGDLDAVRTIGNFAAHPTKSTVTGDIVPVEPGEAEWNLDVLDALFDVYYVAPAKEKARKDALNKKRQEAGKQPLP
jgi:Domain of unknown function (DUF4145)